MVEGVACSDHMIHAGFSLPHSSSQTLQKSCFVILLDFSVAPMTKRLSLKPWTRTLTITAGSLLLSRKIMKSAHCWSLQKKDYLNLS